MRTVIDGVEKVVCWLVGIFMVALALNVLVQVLSRWLKIPTVWTDEVARFSFMWMAMLAASVQVRRRLHFAVTILTDSFRNKRLLNVLSYAIIAFVSWMLFYHGIRYTALGLRKMAATIEMTMVWVYAAIPVGSALMLLFSLELLLGELWPEIFGSRSEQRPESLFAAAKTEENA